MQKITTALFVDEKLINEFIKDIQRSLLQADINVKLVFEITKRMKQRAIEEKPPQGINRKEQLINIVYEELVSFLGGELKKFDIKKKPYKLMLVGLFGNGKTTTAAKLGLWFKKRSYKVALISTDTWRPAAFEQLKQLGQQTELKVFGNPEKKTPEQIYKEFETELNKYDIVIIDTAGRDALNDELIEELTTLNTTVKPNESYLVISADIGQAAEAQAKAFHQTCNVTGVVITKLDGTAKGGGSLIACSVTKAPVRFIGVGEKIHDLEEFNPKGFVGRLLGMGDLEALLEKAKEAITEDQAQDLSKKLIKGDFNLLDLYEQMEAMKKMGPLNKIVEMIPGFSSAQIPKEVLNVQDEKLKLWKFAMQSMTKQELENPELISTTRVDRIANGSGVPPSDVRSLLKQYKQGKKMMKLMKGASSEKGMEKAMQKMMKGKGKMMFK